MYVLNYPSPNQFLEAAFLLRSFAHKTRNFFEPMRNIDRKAGLPHQPIPFQLAAFNW